jgi:hypothetical protein
MAKVFHNIFLQGVSGMIGGQLVIRQLHTGGIIAAPPTSTKKPPTQAQLDHRKQFRVASEYAKHANKVPQYLKLAAKRGVSARSVAIGDFLHPPEVRDIILTGYKGKTGDSIVVRAMDVVEVQAVRVSIFDDQGALIERGECKHPPFDMTRWTYVATVDAAVSRGKVIAEATDIPGHHTELSVDWAG